MKNVMGQDIPIDTPEQLVAFYERNVGPDFPEVDDPRHWGTDQVDGKDKHFLDLLHWAKTLEVETVLDVGADWGKYMWKAHEELKPKRVDCLEISPTKVRNLRQVMDKHKICGTVLEGNAEVEALPQVDLVLAMDVVEHFRDWRAGWKNLLNNSRYVYALIPAGRSFGWSDDHIHVFNYETVNMLIWLAKGVIWREEIRYKDAVNGWYALLVKGFNDGQE